MSEDRWQLGDPRVQPRPLKKPLDSLTYMILTTQPMCFTHYEMELVREQIPGYDERFARGEEIIRAQTIVSDYRKTLYEDTGPAVDVRAVKRLLLRRAHRILTSRLEALRDAAG